MDDLFVIAAGGSGAKVVEALIHLCAADLAPSKVHVLLVDGDASNGNRQRALRTWETYQAVQAWPWRVKPNTGDAAEIGLFNSELKIYSLAEQFSAAESGSLRPLVQEDPELHEALSVVLDDQELDMNMRVGFTGRPNLGCLVMSRYLRRHLRNHDRAKSFIQALEDSSRKSDRSNPRMVVVGSVFGGTGASLLPVARPCVAGVFKEMDANNQPRIELYNRTRWGKVMLLPYFRPQGGVNLGIVNPARHFTDTSGALWYYGLGQADPEPIYLIGSESSDQRKIVAVGGEVGQNNPAFYHELLAALAILDFYHAPQVGNQPIRHFSEVAQSGAQREACALSSLPGPTGISQATVSSRLALLLHLAAFSVDWRESAAPDFPEFHKGLLQYAKKSRLTGWDDSVHKALANERESLDVKGRSCQQVVEYFARLLLWAQTALAAEEFRSSGVDYNPEPGRYASLHNTLCSVTQDEIEVPVNGRFPTERDNLAAKICRLAVAGLARENATREDRDHCGHGLSLRRNELLPDGKTVRLGIGVNTLAAALVSHGFEKAEVDKWFSEFRVPSFKT